MKDLKCEECGELNAEYYPPTNEILCPQCQIEERTGEWYWSLI